MTDPEREYIEFEDPESDQEDAAEPLQDGSLTAVVSGTDWTTETIVSQLQRGNIDLKPRFQRRDAWRRDRKSRLIESLIVGLPVPQIVLAESKVARGKFVVLDGKQRLLALLQFWGVGEGPNNAFALTGMDLRPDLKGKTFEDLSNDPSLDGDYNALCNEAVRTVVIKNWKDSNFLHTVFLRLNTGSVPLSPQELRQALMPGQFADYVDDASAESGALQELLGLNHPDPRMRDVEIVARFIAFSKFAGSYPGRMKAFLDATFGSLNGAWEEEQGGIRNLISDFEEGVYSLIEIFGDRVARKPGSRQFNRAIFDALIYFQSRPDVREASSEKHEELGEAYHNLFKPGSPFAVAVESDTASPHHTLTRLKVWAESLSAILDLDLQAPAIPLPDGSRPAA